jgi:hypothetical protein
MEDDFVALLALDAERRHLFDSPLDATRWQLWARATGALASEHWLLAYEATSHPSLAGTASIVAKDPFFAQLRSAKVSFYDRAPSRARFTGAATPIPGGFLRNASI